MAWLKDWVRSSSPESNPYSSSLRSSAVLAPARLDSTWTDPSSSLFSKRSLAWIASSRSLRSVSFSRLKASLSCLAKFLSTFTPSSSASRESVLRMLATYLSFRESKSRVRALRRRQRVPSVPAPAGGYGRRSHWPLHLKSEAPCRTKVQPLGGRRIAMKRNP
ncbi:hypothetical protein LIER_13923 [Lithospermum erythrorhizon]|uniref:Uncharacterized protein n=1 Tax=Lithospermum erythrorhizon TaxID=34254 RepID=A0AAV3PY55_LITER